MVYGCFLCNCHSLEIDKSTKSWNFLEGVIQMKELFVQIIFYRIQYHSDAWHISTYFKRCWKNFISFRCPLLFVHIITSTTTQILHTKFIWRCHFEDHVQANYSILWTLTVYHSITPSLLVAAASTCTSTLLRCCCCCFCWALPRSTPFSKFPVYCFWCTFRLYAPGAKVWSWCKEHSFVTSLGPN